MNRKITLRPRCVSFCSKLLFSLKEKIKDSGQRFFKMVNNFQVLSEKDDAKTDTILF